MKKQKREIRGELCYDSWFHILTFVRTKELKKIIFTCKFFFNIIKERVLPYKFKKFSIKEKMDFFIAHESGGYYPKDDYPIPDNYVICEMCLEPFYSDELSYCYNCTNDICTNCRNNSNCCVCEQKFCDHCGIVCSHCDDFCCDDCCDKCTKCYAIFCKECVFNCKKCNNRMCVVCLHGHKCQIKKKNLFK